MRKSLVMTVISLSVLGLSGCGTTKADRSESTINLEKAKTSEENHNVFDNHNSGESAKKVSIDWNAPSGGSYPDVSGIKDLNVDVNLKEQRVFIKSGDKTIYTMICSSGKDDSTPEGNFTIKSTRGNSFFNHKLNEGANYWTSFTDDSVYLFHSVPTKSGGQYNIEEAEKLGEPASHGCIRLTVSDAKWIMNNIPAGTPVKIGDD